MFLKLFFSAFLLLLAASDAIAAKRVALIIANGDYADLPKLDKVLDDARPMREILASELGFDVIYGENLGRREMNKKIRDLETQVAKGDIVFIYFAGHGVSLSGDNYMLPIDLQQPEPGEEKFVTSDSFGLVALTKKVQAKGARSTFVVLDASRDNPFAKPGDQSTAAIMGLKKGLDKIELAEGVFVLFSAGLGQSSLDSLGDGDQDPKSVFGRSLVPALKTPGLSQIDLAKKIQAEVAAAAATAGQEQVPVYIDRFRELVTLNGNTGEVYAEAKPGVATDQALILEEWKIVKGSGNRAALEGFKAKYGNDPVWAPLADEELRKLGKQPEASSSEPSSTFSEDAENMPLYRDLQTELKRVGCYSGNADGVWGASSQRALAQFAQRQGLSLKANVDALEVLLTTDEEEICVAAAAPQRRERATPPQRRETATPPQRREVTVTKPRPKRITKTRKRTARPQSTRACWSCTTYSYDTERICVPSRVGNPTMRIPRLIRCRRF